jgi:Nif-specific regulatory protein
MAQTLKSIPSSLEELSSTLLSTLDEGVFFSELSRFLLSVVKHDQCLVYQVHGDSSAQLVSENGEVTKEGKILAKGEGIAGHVVRTKRAYISNNVSRDPLFANDKEDRIAELAVPVACDGIILGTIHFQSKTEEIQFSREDVTNILSVLSEIKRPLVNMKMYLQAKHLNEVLLMKIEEKERELAESKGSSSLGESYKIQDVDIIAHSPIMKELVVLAERVAMSDVNTLIQGEHGVGKETLARRIHCKSSRKDQAFMVVDCSSMSEEDLELELFGKEITDFSLGQQIRQGAIEMSNNGTLLLANIDSLTVGLQSKLAHYISEGLAFRVGGQVPFRSDVRIIASSVKSLKSEVEENLFREDLFYALNTMIMNIPSLRDRKEDIEPLANFILNNGKDISMQKSLSPGVVKALTDYAWPGNIREVQNVIERAYILSDGLIIERDHLSESITEGKIEEVVEENAELFQFSEMTLDELEKKHICRTLDHLEGNKTKTAKMLGITVKTLYNKLHSYGMISPKEA